MSLPFSLMSCQGPLLPWYLIKPCRVLEFLGRVKCRTGLCFGSLPMGKIKGRGSGVACDCDKKEIIKRRAILRRRKSVVEDVIVLSH